MTIDGHRAMAEAVVAKLPRLALRPRVGYDELVAVLREPSAMFGRPGSFVAAAHVDRPVLDWDWLADVLNQVVAYQGTTCTAIMQMVQIASELVRRRGVAICDGSAIDVWVTDPGTECVSLHYILKLDVSYRVATEMDDALTCWLCNVDLCRPGFAISFVGVRADEPDGGSQERRARTDKGAQHADR